MCDKKNYSCVNIFLIGSFKEEEEEEEEKIQPSEDNKMNNNNNIRRCKTHLMRHMTTDEELTLLGLEMGLPEHEIACLLYDNRLSMKVCGLELL